MKKQLRNLALASALVVAGVASAQTLTDDFAYEVPITSSKARYATGHNGKIYYADLSDKTVKRVDADGTITTVLTNENIKGLSLAFDQAGNMIIQAGAFPNAETSQFYLIATPNEDGTFTAADQVIDFSGSDDNCIAAGRADVMPQVIGDVTSEQGAIFYVCPSGAASVYTAYIQSGAKGDYDNIGGYAASSAVNGLSGNVVDNLTFAQPVYNNMDEFMAAVEEGVNPNDAFIVRKRANQANAFKMEDGELTKWATADAFSTAGFTKFNLGGVDYAVFPINIGSHTRNFQVIRVSDGEVMGKTNFAEHAPSAAQNGFSVEVVDNSTAYIYSGFSQSGTVLGVARATFTVPSTPAFEGDPVYIMGHIGSVVANWWNPSVGYEMTLIDNKVYKIDDINIADIDGFGYGYFAFVSVLGADKDDWDSVNASPRYGATAADVPVAKGETVDVAVGDKSWKIAAGNYDFKLDLNQNKLTVEAHSGVNAVEVEEGEAVYYNLQGVEVVNPQNGLYIVKRGNKVTKQYIH